MSLPIPYQNPQAAGFAAISFSGSANPQNVLKLFQAVRNAGTQAAGVWVGLACDGGSPGAGPLFADLVRGLPFPVIGHIHDVFSEGAALAVAFPHRSIAAVGKIGFHQASMNISQGFFQENKLADLLNQCRGHNRGSVMHIHQRLGVDLSAAREWVMDGRVFLAEEAVENGIVETVVDVQFSRPSEMTWLAL